ncbi:MAG: SBBP repeat-containing protein, partial [Promethearchaeota archaeon]
MKHNTPFKLICLILICLSVLSITRVTLASTPQGNTSPLKIQFSTLFGGNGEDGTGRVALDSAGNIVLGSITRSPDFPILNAYQPIMNGSEDGVIIKFSSDGQNLIFSTFFGGTNGEYIYTIAVDSEDNIVVAGTTDSSDFPTKNALNATKSASARDIFLAKFSPDGQELIFSTFICGTVSWVVDLGIDSSDNIILAGSTDTEELLATTNAYQPTKNNFTDAFVTKISGDGQTVLFSTYLGGNQYENIRSMTLDSENNVIISGYTNSIDFPLVNFINNKSISTFDNYISKISSDGRELLFSSYFGGNREWGLTELTVDGNDNILFVGETNSVSFPLVNAYQSEYGGGETDGFVAKLDGKEYSLYFSTFLGGTGYDGVHGVIVDNKGNLIITGTTISSNFPTLNKYQPFSGNHDVFILKMNGIGQINQFATFFGGIGSDYSFGTILDPRTNSIIMFGHTSSGSGFPLVNSYQDEYKGGDFDMFLCKFTIDSGVIIIFVIIV